MLDMCMQRDEHCEYICNAYMLVVMNIVVEI